MNRKENKSSKSKEIKSRFPFKRPNYFKLLNKCGSDTNVNGIDTSLKDPEFSTSGLSTFIKHSINPNISGTKLKHQNYPSPEPISQLNDICSPNLNEPEQMRSEKEGDNDSDYLMEFNEFMQRIDLHGFVNKVRDPDDSIKRKNVTIQFDCIEFDSLGDQKINILLSLPKSLLRTAMQQYEDEVV